MLSASLKAGITTATRFRNRFRWPSIRNCSEVMPSRTAEICRVLRPLTESARIDIRKRKMIAKTARPRIRPPLPRSKESAERTRSVSSVPETIARPKPISSRIRTSAFRSSRRRKTAKAMISHREDQTGRPQCGQSVPGMMEARIMGRSSCRRLGGRRSGGRRRVRNPGDGLDEGYCRQRQNQGHKDLVSSGPVRASRPRSRSR